MRIIAIDAVEWSLSLSVCLLVTLVSPAKMAELTEMPFGGGLTGVDSKNYVLDRDPDLLPRGRGNSGDVDPTEKNWESLLQCTQNRLNL